MRWILLTATLVTTTASALVFCAQITEAYAPTFASATLDDEDVVIEATPDAIVAGADQQIEFRYGSETLVFVPAEDAR